MHETDLMNADAGLKCWAYSPPGGLVSRALLKIMDEWTISVVCGKDAVPRASVNNLSRLMDEMVTALARCKCAACCCTHALGCLWHSIAALHCSHALGRSPHLFYGCQHADGNFDSSRLL